MTAISTTGTLTAGSSKTFNLAPGSALSLTLSPNVRVTITETPETVSGSGVGGNASRVHRPELAGTFAYGPYAMGGGVVVAVASNSGSSVAWTRKDTVVTTDSTGTSLVDAAGKAIKGTISAFRSMMFVGDSFVEGAAYFTLIPLASNVGSIGAAFAIKGTELSCPAGVGVLSHDAATKTLTWTPFGLSAGAAVNAAATGFLYVPGPTAKTGIYLDWFGATRTYTTGTANLTARAVGFAATQNNSNGFPTTAMAFAQQAVSLAYMDDALNGNKAIYGLGGAMSAEILAAAAQYSGVRCDIACICAGQNDGPNSIAASVTFANIQGIAAAISANQIIVCSLPPRNADTATQQAVKQQVNRMLYDWCRAVGYLFFDLNGTVADPATGNWLSTYSTDNVHPNGRGSVAIGRALGSLILKAVGWDVSQMRPSYFGKYDATNNPRGSLFATDGMGTFEGSGGTAGTGASGTIPAGWRVRRTTGAAMTAVGAKVAYTDRPGNEFRLTFASAAADEVVTVDPPGTISTGLAVGDVVKARITFNVVSSTNLNQLALAIYDNGSTTQARAMWNLDGVLGDFTGQMVVETNDWTLITGFTNLTFQILIGFANGGSGVIGIPQVDFFKVPQS